MLVKYIVWFIFLFKFVNCENSSLISNIQKSLFVSFIKHEGEALIKRINTNNTCSDQLNYTISAALREELWALKFIDATGKMNSGYFDGNFINLAAFDECLAVRHKYEDEEVKGKYCISLMTYSNVPKNLSAMMKNYNLVNRMKMFNNGSAAPVLQGICIPQTCTANDLRYMYKNSHIQVPNLTIQFTDKYCVTADEPDPLDLYDWGAILFFGIVALLIGLSTVYDLYLRKNEKKPIHEVFLCGSLRINLHKLTNIKYDDDQVLCINGLRFISMMWVMLGHRYFLGTMYPTINLLTVVEEWPLTVSSSLITGATVSVDTFFFISGFLVMYIVFLAKNQGIQFNILQYYLLRIVRLSPAFIAVIIFYASFFRHLATGPLWKIANPVIVDNCRKNWWQSIIYIQNFIKPGRICVGQSWYLAADTQFYFVAPFMFLPLQKWPRITLVFMVILTLASCFTAFFIAWFEHANASVFKAFNFYKQLYSSPIVRINAWLVGAICGYILFKIRGKKIKIRTQLVFFLWILSLSVMAFIIYSMVFFFRYEYNQIASSMYYGFSRCLWAIGLAWIVFACTHGYGGLVNKFLSCRLFIVLGRLTYAMFLVHVGVLVYFLASGKSNSYFSNMTKIHEFWGDMPFVMVISVIWTLVFESPVIAIGKILLPNRIKEKLEYPETNGHVTTHL